MTKRTDCGDGLSAFTDEPGDKMEQAKIAVLRANGHPIAFDARGCVIMPKRKAA